MNLKPMLNAYPDSLGGTLGDIVTLLKQDDMKGVFGSFYILPSLYHSDLDRGFSVIDYDINEELAERDDLEALKEVGIDLKLDFILNHASAQSPQFKDLVEKGDASEYKNFFIDWNAFWEGYGSMTEEGYIQPDETYIKDMFFRKPGLPILMVQFPGWNQNDHIGIHFTRKSIIHSIWGQMDLDIRSGKVMGFYRKHLQNRFLWRKYCAGWMHFAYAPKGSWTEKFSE